MDFNIPLYILWVWLYLEQGPGLKVKFDMAEVFCVMWDRPENLQVNNTLNVKVVYNLNIKVTRFWSPNVEEVGGAYCFLDVCACVRPCVRPLQFLMHSITSEPCMLGFWNFIYGFFMKKYLICFFPIAIMPLSWVMALWKKMGEILSAKYLKSYCS